MLKIFVEVHTQRIDGRLAVVRKETPNNREAIFEILKTLSEGFYYTRTKDPTAAMILFEKPISHPMHANWGGDLKDWEYGNSPVFHNDYGEVTTICIRRYAEAAQVTQGTFYI